MRNKNQTKIKQIFSSEHIEAKKNIEKIDLLHLFSKRMIHSISVYENYWVNLTAFQVKEEKD